MPEQSQSIPLRTIVLLIILGPLIIYLLYFAYQKNTESEMRANQCRQECSDQGYAGYDFKWSVLSGPQCECLEENQ